MRKMKKILSLLIVLCMVCGAMLNHLPALQVQATEQATDASEAASKKNLNHITFEDFGISDGTYTTLSRKTVSDETLGKMWEGTGKRLYENAMFTGKLQFGTEASAADMIYFPSESANADKAHYLQVAKGGTKIRFFYNYIGKDGGWGDYINAEDCGLTSFRGVEFELSFSYETKDLDSDNAQDDCLFTVYVEGAKVQEKKLKNTYSDQVGYMGNTLRIVAAAGVTVTSCRPTGYYEDLTFSNFGLENQEYKGSGIGGTYAGTLDYTQFAGKITFTNAGRRIINYGATTTSSNANLGGLQMYYITGESSDSIQILSGTRLGGGIYNDADDTLSFTAADYGVALGTEFTLAITAEKWDVNGDGTQNDGKIGYRINGKLLGGRYIIIENMFSETDSIELVSRLGLVAGANWQTEAAITIESVGNGEQATEASEAASKKNLNHITFEDFGVSDGSYTTLTRKTVSDSTLGKMWEGTGKRLYENAMFTGKLQFGTEASAADMIYFPSESENADKAHYLQVHKGGTKIRFFYNYIGKDGGWGDYINAEDCGLTSFRGVEFELSFSYETKDLDSDNAQDDCLFTVYVEGKKVQEKELKNTYSDQVGYMGNTLRIVAAAGVTVKSCRPTGYYKDLTFSNFGLENQEYKGSGIGGTYAGTLDYTQFAGTVTFTNTGRRIINYGATTTSSNANLGGLQMYYITGETSDSIQILSGTRLGGGIYNDADNTLSFTAGDYDIALGTAFTLTITAEKWDVNGDGIQNDGKIGYRINGELLGGRYIIIENMFSETDDIELVSRLGLVAGANWETEATIIIASVGNSTEGGGSESGGSGEGGSGEGGSEEGGSGEGGISPLPVETEALTLFELNVGDWEVKKGQKSGSSSGTLKNVSIEGVYNFSQNGNQIFFGANWKGVQLQMANGELLVNYVDTDGTKKLGKVTKDIAQVESLCGTNLRMAVSFVYFNEQDQITDMQVQIRFGDGQINSFNVTGANKSVLKRYMMIYSSSENNPISCQSLPIEKPHLEQVSLNQFMIADGLYHYNADNLLVEGKRATTVMNSTFTTKVTFSNHVNSRIIYGGSKSAWYGVSIRTQKDGSLLIYGSGEFSEQYTLKPSVAERNLIGEELELTLELFEDGKDGVLGIYIDGKLYNNQYFRLTLKDAAEGENIFGNYFSCYATKEGATIRLGAKTDSPSVDESFTKLTFNSFGIASGTYTYNKNNLAASGTHDLDSLDRVVFSDTIQFSEASGARFHIGGKQSAWYGLNIRNTKNGTLTLNEATGKISAITFKPEIAGTELVGKDIDFAMSFEYVDYDGDGFKDDIKLGVWFNGKAYADRWIYLRDVVDIMGSYMGIYCSNEKTYFKLQTELIPIDFTEFGFTKRWAYELKLKK